MHAYCTYISLIKFNFDYRDDFYFYLFFQNLAHEKALLSFGSNKIGRQLSV